MNILFFLTPKCDVAYVKEEDSLRNTLEKMEFHRYSAIPVLSKDGKFAGTLTEGGSSYTVLIRSIEKTGEKEEEEIRKF